MANLNKFFRFNEDKKERSEMTYDNRDSHITSSLSATWGVDLQHQSGGYADDTALSRTLLSLWSARLGQISTRPSYLMNAQKFIICRGGHISIPGSSMLVQLKRRRNLPLEQASRSHQKIGQPEAHCQVEKAFFQTEAWAGGSVQEGSLGHRG